MSAISAATHANPREPLAALAPPPRATTPRPADPDADADAPRPAASASQAARGPARTLDVVA